MPKATWGTGDEALTAADIDGAESREGFAPYAGPLPPAGVYRFILKFAKKGESGSGNPKLQILLELDGSWKEQHAKFDKCPLWDNMPVMKSTAWRVAAFNEAIGATSADFAKGMVVDEDGKVTKIGKVGDPSGLYVYVSVKQRAASGGYDASLQLNGAGYLPAPEDGDDADDQDGSDDADDNGDDEPPF